MVGGKVGIGAWGWKGQLRTAEGEGVWSHERRSALQVVDWESI